MESKSTENRGWVVGIAAKFLSGPLSILLIVASLLLGALALWVTPQEEDPQIVVPMADVAVQFPGHSPAEVEQLVTRPLERLLWQVDGVEHVYSVSRRDQAMVTVRFFVGQDRERSIVKLRDQIDSHLDIVPSGVAGWVVKPAQIDDVPIVALTFYAPGMDPAALRRVVEERKVALDGLPDLSRSEIFGGQPREIRIEPDLEALAGHGLCLADLQGALQANEPGGDIGPTLQQGQVLTLRPRPQLDSAVAVAQVVLRSPQGRTVRIGDVAQVRDGPAEPDSYHHLSLGPAAAEKLDGRVPAVTLAFAKKKGTNAVKVAEAVIARAEELQAADPHGGVRMLVTRNYGETAKAKVDELLWSMFLAIATVVVLMAVAMGWRESLVVALSVPVSFALALFVNYLVGYSINRVTLFALILSLGLVVDDPIINVDNIQRHIRMGLKKPAEATLDAVHEMVGPVIMSALTVIVSFLPMFYITGMMGPYMRPMAINVPLTIGFSALCAITFVPWLSYMLLKGKAGEASTEDVTPGWIRRGYRFALEPFLQRRRAWWLLGGLGILFLASGLLVLFRQVPLKMLPFDNKNELQLVVDMPEGTAVEATDRVCQELEQALSRVPEVKDVETYSGLASPIDFNGLVRHYGWRQAPNLAELRINLVSKEERKLQSHELALQLRDPLTAIARRHGAQLSIVELPPGPPVLSTITVEVYGTPAQGYGDLIAGAKALESTLAATDPKHLVQIDDYSETPRQRLELVVDQEKAAVHGLAPASVAQALRGAVGGLPAGLLHDPYDRDPLRIRVRLPFADRLRPERLEQLWLRGGDGKQVQLGELAKFVAVPEDQPIYRKDLERVVFVTAESAGRAPGELILETQANLKKTPLPNGIRAKWTGEGEWQITVDVFRDLGIAFAVALAGIYLLLVLQTGNFAIPGVMMLAIPLTAIGIMPGFWLLNLLGKHEVAGYPNPVFFTATAMIGMIALGGIVIRNSIVLIEFIQEAQREGKALRQALLDSGAVRFRPIVLTALTAMLGAWPITLDPIFSGLAWALIFGLFASTAFTLLVIPVAYFLMTEGPSKS